MREQDWGLDPCKVGGGGSNVRYGEEDWGVSTVGYGEGCLDEGVHY